MNLHVGQSRAHLFRLVLIVGACSASPRILINDFISESLVPIKIGSVVLNKFFNSLLFPALPSCRTLFSVDMHLGRSINNLVAPLSRTHSLTVLNELMLLEYAQPEFSWPAFSLCSWIVFSMVLAKRSSTLNRLSHAERTERHDVWFPHLGE